MPKANLALTEEHVPRGTARALVVTLLVAVVAFGLSNAALRRELDRRTHNRALWLIQQKWELLERVAGDVDTVVLGDSAGNQGVRPDVLSERLGGAAVNYCTIGDMLAVNDAWMLERHLERHAPPKRVIVVHAYDVWHRSAKVLRHKLLWRVPEPWGFWEEREPKVALESRAAAELFVRRYLPVYYEHKTIAEWVTSPSTLAPAGFSLDGAGYMRLDEAKPDRVKRDAASHVAFLRKRQFSLSKANRNALARLEALGEKHGFEIFLANAPIYEGLRREPQFVRYFAALDRELGQIADASPRLSYVLREPVTFPASAMENADHLTHAAAAEYTAELAKAIATTPTDSAAFK